MVYCLNRMMRVIRADISALMLIAFLFQLLTPIVVLASGPSADSEFQNALRSSICRVIVDDSEQSPDTPSHTDGFVCSWCVLCSVDAQVDNDLLPEVVFRNPLAGLPQSIEGANGFEIAFSIQANPFAPRAPPYQ